MLSKTETGRAWDKEDPQGGLVRAVRGIRPSKEAVASLEEVRQPHLPWANREEVHQVGEVGTKGILKVKNLG